MVTLVTDHTFQIALTHARDGVPCQDYALSGVLANGTAYAVVADGCSSGRHTDIGARIIGRASIPAEDFSGRELAHLPELTRNVQYNTLKMVRPLLDVTTQDLVATSVVAVMTPKDGGVVHLRGDGAIALAYADGRVEAYVFEPQDNAPVYPAYALDAYAGIKARYGNDDTVDSLRWQRFVLKEVGPELLNEGVLSLREACEGFTLHLSADEVQSLRTVAVFTDGIMQVKGMSWHKVVRELLAFKGVGGKFVVRRMNRFLEDLTKVDEHGLRRIFADTPKPKNGNDSQMEAWAAQVARQMKKPSPLLDDLGYAVIQIAPDPDPKEGE